MKVWILILVLIILYWYTVTETFQDLDPEFVNKYNTFVAFYNPFLTNWEKAVMTSMSMEIVQQPLTSPSQIGSATATSPAFSRSKMNQYIHELSQTRKQPLPPLTDPLPTSIDPSMIPALVETIPQDPAPYQNALNWMNERLASSHQNLDGALQGKSAEGFADNCAEISQCMSDPEVVRQITEQQDAQRAQKQRSQQQTISLHVDQFNQNSSLQQAISQNNDLVQQSKNIQNQAQSGELLNKMNLPEDPIAAYQIPKGGNRLKQMKEEDPEKYNEYEKNNSVLFSLKQWMEQINRSL